MCLQVPRNGYVIIRTKLDNPGHWLVHCHIDVHVKQGMSLVVKIGETGDWNTGPESLDVECSEQKPRSLEGSLTLLTKSSNNHTDGARINLSLQSPDILNPRRCIKKGISLSLQFS